MGTDPQGGLARSSRPEHHSDADACGTRLAGAAWLLLAGTLVLVVDVAVEGVALPGGSLNLVNDVAGAVLVLMGAQRVATAARAAAPLAGQVLIGLAVLNLLAALAGELGADKPVQVAAAWVQLGGVTALAWILQHASNGPGRHNPRSLGVGREG